MAENSDTMEELRQKLLPDGAASFGSLGITFRKFADKDRRTLHFEEFVKGLNEFGVSIENEEAKAVFEKFDKDGNGTLDVNEFLIALRPPMTEIRKQTIIEVFQKIDKAGDGEITVEDLKGVYNPKMHPNCRSKKWTEEKASLAYLSMFESPGEKDGKITLEEFMNFYANVSANIAEDDVFIQVIKSAWKI